MAQSWQRVGLGLLALGLSLGGGACKGGSKTCLSIFLTGSDTDQTLAVTQCEDEVRRDVRCQKKPDTPWACECLLAGTVSKSFSRADGLPQDEKKALSVANQECGWQLSP